LSPIADLMKSVFLLALILKFRVNFAGTAIWRTM
jgi:hypothetical protein